MGSADLNEVIEESVELGLGDLKQDPYNTRLHDKKNLAIIKDSLEEIGAARSIVIDGEGNILAGHGTVEAAKALGLNLRVIKGDPKTLVAVQVDNLSDAQKARYNMYDNRATDASKNNVKAINRLVEKYPEQQLLDGIFDAKSQEKLLKAQANAQPLASGGADDAGQPLEGEAEIRQESSIRMMPVFLTTENHPEIVRKLRRLGEQVFNMTVITDIVVATIERAEQEWCAKTETAESADVAGEALEA